MLVQIRLNGYGLTKDTVKVNLLQCCEESGRKRSLFSFFERVENPFPEMEYMCTGCGNRHTVCIRYRNGKRGGLPPPPHELPMVILHQTTVVVVQVVVV